jgi:hypothetical protein
VHEPIGADDLTAGSLPDALMAEADSSVGLLGPSGHHIAAIPASFGAGSQSTIRSDSALDLVEGHLVVPIHGNLCPEFAEILY